MEPDRKLCDNLVKLSDWCFEMYVSNYTVKIRLRHAGLKYGGVRNRLRLLPYIGEDGMNDTRQLKQTAKNMHHFD